MEKNEQHSGYFPLSILDLVPVLQDQTVEASFKNSLELARHAEKLGYKNVKHMSAGISGWLQAGEKTEKGG